MADTICARRRRRICPQDGDGTPPPGKVERVMPTTDQPAAPPRAHWERWAVLFLLLSAVTLRVLTVGTYDLWLDEFWTMELSTGRGSLHLDLPHNVVLDEAPRTTQLDGAPPWWTVWTS